MKIIPTALGCVIGIFALTSCVSNEKLTVHDKYMIDLSSLVKTITTGTSTERKIAEAQLYYQICLASTQDSTQKPPSKAALEFEKQFGEFRAKGMAGQGSRQDFELYCRTFEAILPDLKSPKDKQEEIVARQLLRYLTTYSAYRYESWVKSWPWLKSEYEARENWHSTKP